MLDLDCDGLTVGQLGAVHLTDRSAGDRRVSPAGEEAFDGAAQLGLDQGADGFCRRVGCGATQGAKRLFVNRAVRFWHEAVDVTGGLAQLGREPA